jgi:succinylglutamate desuccinylase
MFVTKGSDKIAELFKKKSNKDDKAFKAKKGRLGSTVEVEKALKFLQSEIDKAEKMRNKVKGLEELEQLYMRAELEMALVSENLGRNKETYLLRYEKLIEDLGKKQEERERDTKKSSRIISDT